MGQRANLIVVEHQGYTLYYDHWAANCLDSYLFWGPQQVVPYIRQHEKSGQDWWLDTVWCEGGAVVDLDRNVLLFFGGEDFEYEIPLRQVYFQLLAYLWPGYELRWAYHGIVDLADYVGYGCAKVIDAGSLDLPSPLTVQRAFGGESPQDLQGVLSICEGGMPLLYPLYGYAGAVELLTLGEGLIATARQYPAHEQYCYPDLTTEQYLDFPKLGIHIDKDHRQVFYWSAQPDGIKPECLEPLWNGWEIVFLYDRYEEHALLLQNRLEFPTVEQDRVLTQLKKIVCMPYRRGDEIVDKMMARLTADGSPVEMNPAVYATNLFDLPVELREQIFGEVVARWKHDTNQ